MTTYLNRGFSFLNRSMEAAAAESVRYTRGAVVVSDALTATLSNQQIQQITDGESVLVGRQFTWQLKRSELMFDSQPTEPMRGDLIEWKQDGRTYVFEVLPEASQPEAGIVDMRLGFLPAAVKVVDVR